MESYPWWAEDHKKLAQEVEVFAEEVMPRDEETRWRRDFPWDIFEKVPERGYTGAGIPKEYGRIRIGGHGRLYRGGGAQSNARGSRVFVGNILEG